MATQNNKVVRWGIDVLKCEGDLSAIEMTRMKGRMNRLLNRNHKKWVLDMGSTQRVELAGIGILVDRLRHVREHKGDIKICNLRPEVEKTLRMIGVGSLIESYSSEEEALRSFAA